MTDKKKPSWFQWLDLTILVPGVLTLVLLVYAMANGGTGPRGWQLGMAFVGAAFVGIWARVCYLRKSDIDGFRWYPKYGIMAKPGGYSLPDDQKLDSIIALTVGSWSKFYGDKAEKALTSDIVWVFFKKELNENANNAAHAKVAGYTVSRSHSMNVDFDTPDQPLESTSFEHELGHIIMGFVTGEWDQEVHHAFMAANGLK